jgi:hypothetical protein
MRTMMMMLGATLAMAGCVSDEPVEDGAGEWGDGGGDGKADGTAAPGTLASKYALELTSTMKLEDTRESGDARFSTFALRARALVTTTQNGEAVKLAVKLCDVKLPEVSGYQPVLSPTFITGLPSFEITGTLVDDGGWKLTTKPAAMVLGAQLTDPVRNALPTTGSDARVIDQDGDGKPGVSIDIGSWGKIYAAMRVLVAMDAKVAGAPSISGNADIQLDQAIFGDSIPFYDAAGSLAESQPYTRVVSAANAFRLKSGATTCATVASTFP